MKNTLTKIWWSFLAFLLIVTIRGFFISVGHNYPVEEKLSEKDLFLMATKDCYKQSASTLGLEENSPIVVEYCGCYGNTVKQKYNGMTKRELVSHTQEFVKIGEQCFTDVSSRYQQYQ